MYLYREGRMAVDKARFDDAQCSLWIVQYDNGVILNYAARDVAIVGTDTLRHAEEEARQIHGVAAEIAHGTASALLQVEKMGGQPAVRIFAGANGAVV